MLASPSLCGSIAGPGRAWAWPGLSLFGQLRPTLCYLQEFHHGKSSSVRSPSLVGRPAHIGLSLSLSLSSFRYAL